MWTIHAAQASLAFVRAAAARMKAGRPQARVAAASIPALLASAQAVLA